MITQKGDPYVYQTVQYFSWNTYLLHFVTTFFAAVW